MNVLIDINHPAHVHLFKNFAWEMESNGHEILFTCREKEFEIDLLKDSGFNFISFGKKYETLAGKIFGLFKFNFKLFKVGLKFRPDIFLSSGSIYAAHVSFLLRKGHVSLEDTGNMEQVRMYLPFTNIVLTSDSFHRDFGKKQIRYPGYHEIAYLHSKYFTPDESVLKKLGLKENEKFIIVRFISWKATHDFGVKGLKLKDKIRIVQKLSDYCKVFISSETELPIELSEYEINIKPNEMHSALFYSSLLFGESGTMTSECFILGVPAIQISGLPEGAMGTLAEQNKSGLIYVHERYSEDILDTAIQLIKNKNVKREWSIKKDKILSDRIDLTEFLIWFIENFPKSVKMLKKNQIYMQKFKLIKK